MVLMMSYFSNISLFGLSTKQGLVKVDEQKLVNTPYL